MRHEKAPLLVIVCVAALVGAFLLAGCRTRFVPYFLSRSAPENTQVQEQAAEQPPEEISEQDSTPAPEPAGEKTVEEGSASAPVVAPESLPAETSGEGRGTIPEEVPEEIVKPLPELKVKGHF